jgi:hypothetical protein
MLAIRISVAWWPRRSLSRSDQGRRADSSTEW